MTEPQIEAAAEALFEGALNAEEYAHDGDWVPKEYRAKVWNRLIDKVTKFASYLAKEKTC